MLIVPNRFIALYLLSLLYLKERRYRCTPARKGQEDTSTRPWRGANQGQSRLSQL